MPHINYASGVVYIKVVYWGPRHSGKTANIIFMHKSVGDDPKNCLISIDQQDKEGVFFDMLTMELGKIKDFSLVLQLFTVAGIDVHSEAGKILLMGADGIIFVADSQLHRMDANVEAKESLLVNLKEIGIAANKVSMVVQYNKRDLENIASIKDMRTRLNPQNLPDYNAVAISGDGVFDTLKGMIRPVLKDLKDKI